jgi:hypothetical protein
MQLLREAIAAHTTYDFDFVNLFYGIVAVFMQQLKIWIKNSISG